MRALLTALVVLLTLVTAPAPAQASTEEWRGSRHAQPAAYDWLTGYTPDADYEVFVVRGLSPVQVRRTLGPVVRRLRDLTPTGAERWVSNRTRRDYTAPHVALVHRRGPAVFVYVPYWILPTETIARLSRKGRVAHFTTTVELDTYVTVARRGKVVRSFDAGFRPPRKGAWREERGLDWGARDQNIFATAWAFLERVSRIHMSREWVQGEHPVYVFEGRS